MENEINCTKCMIRFDCSIFKKYDKTLSEEFSTTSGFCYKWKSNGNDLEDFMEDGEELYSLEDKLEEAEAEIRDLQDRLEDSLDDYRDLQQENSQLEKEIDLLRTKLDD